MARPRTIWTVESLLAHTVEEGDCLLWRGSMRSKWGAPLVYHQGERQAVRRLLLRLLGKDVAAGGFVHCTCGNRLCINPKHLRVMLPAEHFHTIGGMPAKNEQLRRARLAAHRQRHGVLTIEQVREIRSSPESAAELARRFGVHKSLTARIRRGLAWVDRSNPWAGL